LGFPRAYFDGAAQNGICACGVYIITKEDQQFSIYWNGEGTNNKVEAMALSGLLQFSIFLNIESLHIYGDSKFIIDHVNANISIKNHNLTGWMNRIDSLWRSTKDYTITHVDRSQNSHADELSKKGLQIQTGKWKMNITMGNEMHQIQDFSLPGA